METGKSFLLQKINTSIWFVRPEILQVLQGVLNTKFNEGLKIGSFLDVAPKAAIEGSEKITDGKMVIPISGVMLNKAGGLDALCGVYGYNMLKGSLQAAWDNDDVNHVILDWDSPGGMSCGCSEMANEVRTLATKKRVTSICTGQMCSAAYYIGSAADEIYASDPMCIIGSIGCYMLHCDQSSKDAQDGLKFTYVKAGKYKTLGNEHEPLDDGSKSILQDMVNNAYDMFLSDVATNRNTSVDAIKNLAEGKIYDANKAPKALFDGIKTLDELLMMEV